MPYAAAQGPTTAITAMPIASAEEADPKNVLLWDYIARKAQIGRPNLFALLPDYVFTVSDHLRPTSAPRRPPLGRVLVTRAQTPA